LNQPNNYFSNKAEDIFQLVYVSEACPDLSYTDLENILYSARKKNVELNVTGLLIFRDGFFIQYLEGKESHVKEILGRIVQDRRHKKVRVIGEWTSTNRLFENWSMSFIDGDLIDQLHPFLQKILSDAMLVNWPDQSEFQVFYDDFIKTEVIL